jgi:hypothetical protein
MSTLGRTSIRIAGDAANFDAPLDVNSRATPMFWAGNDIQFEIAVFDDGVLQSVANLASVTVEIRAPGPGGSAPDPSSSPLMSGTVDAGCLNDTVTLETWNDGSQQQALIAFSSTQTNIAAGAQWMTLWVITNDDPGRVITLAAGPIRVLEDGAGLTTTPPTPDATYYTAAQSDARYLASPAFSGTPTAPTPAAGDNSTNLATTAFVQAALSPANANWRAKNGNTMQFFNPTTQLWHSVWVQVVNGIPALALEQTGEG